MRHLLSIRPFPSCFEPRYEREVKVKSFVISLAFIMRFIVTRKWFIVTRKWSPVRLNQFLQVIPVHIPVDILAGSVDGISCVAFSSPRFVVHIVRVIISSKTSVQTLTNKNRQMVESPVWCKDFQTKAP